MALADRLTAGSIIALALVLLTGFALVGGPTFAQETTDDGMGGNETMADGTETAGNETMDGSMATETEMDGGSMTEEESMADDSMTDDEMDDGTTEDDMSDDGMAEDQMTDEEMADETASDGQPGFGVVVGLLALVAAAVFALYRRRA